MTTTVHKDSTPSIHDLSNPVDVERWVRATVWPYAKTGIGADSILDDLMVGTPGRVLGYQRVRAIVREEYDRAALMADERLDARAASVPTLPITDDGLAEALEFAGWRLRWNATARTAEARRTGDDDDWQECSGLTRDLMLNDCSRAASMLHNRRIEPWRIPGRTLESRLIAVVAARETVKAAGSAVYERVREWAANAPSVRAATLGEVLQAIGGLQKFESAQRAPKPVLADAATALRDAGWSYKSVRIGGEVRKRWASPDGQRATGSLVAAFGRLRGDKAATGSGQ